MMPRIKICCIGSVAEAQLAVAHGASALGLVSEMPSGPGVIPDDQISAIAATVPKFIGTFLLTSRTDSAPIIEHIRRCGTNTVQLVDAVGENVYQDLRRELPDIRIVQVVHVTGDAAVEEARRIAGRVDALLLDSGNPTLEIKELGGTGRTHDWNRSRQIVESVKCPVFLAGGLNHRNILDAVRQVQPYGVDICTGVRTEGRLDPLKLTDFFAAIRRLAS
ncbi:MAG TPA: phosphoribosylanthranilate isomerase [Verrucomicrobiae bacterium]|nr:phosphoribosylanthranilate isomerase [Verrucomicrobiae bacterium]